MTYVHIHNQVRAEVFPDVRAVGNSYSLLLFGFYFFHAAYFDFKLDNDTEKFNALRALWRLLRTGIGFLAIIVFLLYGVQELNLHTNMIQGKALGYAISIYIFCIFFNQSLFTFRRFILYETNRQRVRSWNLMRILLVVMLVCTTNIYGLHEWLGLIYSLLLIPLLFFFFAYIMYLTADISWASQLNSREKIRVIFILIALFFVYLAYFFLLINITALFDFYNKDHEYYDLFYISGLFAIFYTILSVIVLASHYRTSLILEAQTHVIQSFKKINQAITTHLEEPEILNTLLNGAMALAGADAGWIEMFHPDEAERFQILTTKGISKELIKLIFQNHGLVDNVLISREPYAIKRMEGRSLAKSNNENKYQSLLCVPIFSNQHNYGAVILLKKYEKAFEDYTINTISSLAEQTGAALEHRGIVAKSLESERYREQIKIAQDVQNTLLPKKLPAIKGIDMAIENRNAEEIGGDFYDIFRKDDNTIRFGIGDISGHGTTAAFYMAVVKGIFHTIAQGEGDVRDAVLDANRVIKRCFSSGNFFTFTYSELQLTDRSLTFLRAGHCPTFYYHAQSQKVEIFTGNSIGLGIVGDAIFARETPSPTTLHFQTNDILLLLTDGILEAKNVSREEFDIHRVKSLLLQNKHESAQHIASILMEDVQRFTEKNSCEDDMTVWVMKFS
jgi:phosphoserine phosphatase RsbU/P